MLISWKINTINEVILPTVEVDMPNFAGFTGGNGGEHNGSSFVEISSLLGTSRRRTEED